MLLMFRKRVTGALKLDLKTNRQLKAKWCEGIDGKNQRWRISMLSSVIDNSQMSSSMLFLLSAPLMIMPESIMLHYMQYD
jgi:hypothetical protein